MEKGQESKQKRKTPLTTIAISQEYAQKLDEYLNGTGITRKEFVELSVDYFQRTGFDLRGEAFDLSPLEKVTGRLEQSAKIMEQANEGTEAVLSIKKKAISERYTIKTASRLLQNDIACPADRGGSPIMRTNPGNKMTKRTSRQRTTFFFFFPKHLPAKHRVFVKGEG